MNSYTKDLELFEELLAYRNERELTEWEVEQFCRLVEKHPHFIERISKDSQVEAMLSSLDEEEYRELGFKLPADNVIQLPPMNNQVNYDVPNGSVFWRVAAVVCAVLFIGVLVSINLEPKKEDSQNSSVATLDPIVSESSRPLTAQELYEQQIAKIPEVGSMDRPPTKFSNTNPHEGAELSYAEIRPILSEYCFHCHGFDEHSREADLRLDTPDGMLKKSAIVPGKPEESEAIARIFHDDPDEIMPPPKMHKTMTSEEKNKIKKWIEQGAKWERHWAYELPKRANPPTVSLKAWNKNPIDKFVYAKLKEKGLNPNPPADSYTLARRLSFDLTGLPLSPKQIQTYVEPKLENKYETLISDLINTDAYGEHRAHYWLDAARYGDTHGLHNDRYREMWLYRDWVIDAFNSNKPFDEFTLEQFAGDLLPDSTVDQKIATGFHRCNVTSNEGGAIDEELLVRYNVDRVATTGTVFMGLTVGCAQCHDHKFDPISQKEFYQLFAFFNNTSQRGRDGGKKDTAPSIVVQKGVHVDEYNKLNEQYESLKNKISLIENQTIAENSNFDLTYFDKLPSFSFKVNDSQGNTTLNVQHGESQTIKELPKGITWNKDKRFGQVLNIDRKEGLTFPKAAAFDPDQAMSISFWIKASNQQKNGDVIKQYNPKSSKMGWRVQLTGFKPTFQVLSDDKKFNNLYVVSNTVINKNKWTHVSISYSGKRNKDSVEMYINGEVVSLKKEDKFSKLEGDVKTSAPLVIAQNFKKTLLHDFRVELRETSPFDAKLAFQMDQLKDSFKKPWDKLKGKELEWKKRLYHVQTNPSFENELNEYFKLEVKKKAVYNRFPTALVMNEKATLPMANILDRGEYDKKKEEVGPGVPQAIGAWKAEYPKNRLGLAKWIVSKENPLTARVTVNRLWQEFFGHGIVRSADDFGAMGTLPTHPELLDWLAVEFVESGWDIQHIIKLIVNSKTYQQSSQFKDQHHRLDPENHFLARGPRFRLRAEALRDQALAVSGLLVHQTGGKSVKPYQPDGLWKALFNTSFVQDKGDDLYRRSLYTFWKRTVAPPSMAIFNAPSRETCIVKRENTNTPMQALTLMNDEQFVEASRVLAERMMRDEKSEQKIIRSMGYRILGYPMTEQEQSKLSKAYQEYRDYFKENGDEAKDFITIGEYPLDETLDPVELSAWTMLASTLMNRDDVINKN